MRASIKRECACGHDDESHRYYELPGKVRVYIRGACMVCRCDCKRYIEQSSAASGEIN